MQVKFGTVPGAGIVLGGVDDNDAIAAGRRIGQAAGVQIASDQATATLVQLACLFRMRGAHGVENCIVDGGSHLDVALRFFKELQGLGGLAGGGTGQDGRTIGGHVGLAARAAHLLEQRQRLLALPALFARGDGRNDQIL